MVHCHPEMGGSFLMEQEKQLETIRRDAFVVRIWQEAGWPGWRGWVQHIRSGESAAVRDADELVAFIENRVGAATQDAGKGLR